MRNHLVAIALLATTALSPAALGQAAPSEKAEALFAEGREALAKGDYEVACSKLAESFTLSGAVGPLLNLADCEEKRGRLATALDRWKQGAARLASKPDDSRNELAKERITVLERRVPRLSIKLAGDAPQGTTVSLDGDELGSLKTPPIPLNPGEHRLVAAAPGYEPRAFAVTLAPGDEKELIVSPGASIPIKRPKAPSSSGGGAQRTAGFIVGGLGVGGLIAGGVTGALMLSKKATVDARCDPMTKICDQEGFDAAEAGATLGVANAIAFAAGAVGVGVGAFLIIRSYRADATSTEIKAAAIPNGAGLSLKRMF
jgi:hypothetical protein